jgi:hypothetical protein
MYKDEHEAGNAGCPSGEFSDGERVVQAERGSPGGASFFGDNRWGRHAQIHACMSHCKS